MDNSVTSNQRGKKTNKQMIRSTVKKAEHRKVDAFELWC